MSNPSSGHWPYDFVANDSVFGEREEKSYRAFQSYLAADKTLPLDDPLLRKLAVEIHLQVFDRYDPYGTHDQESYRATSQRSQRLMLTLGLAKDPEQAANYYTAIAAHALRAVEEQDRAAHPADRPVPAVHKDSDGRLRDHKGKFARKPRSSIDRRVEDIIDGAQEADDDRYWVDRIAGSSPLYRDVIDRVNEMSNVHLLAREKEMRTAAKAIGCTSKEMLAVVNDHLVTKYPELPLLHKTAVAPAVRHRIETALSSPEKASYGSTVAAIVLTQVAAHDLAKIAERIPPNIKDQKGIRDSIYEELGSSERAKKLCVDKTRIQNRWRSLLSIAEDELSPGDRMGLFEDFGKMIDIPTVAAVQAARQKNR